MQLGPPQWLAIYSLDKNGLSFFHCMLPLIPVTGKCTTVIEKHQKGVEIVHNTLSNTLAFKKTKTQQQIKASNHLVTMFSGKTKETGHHRASTTFEVYKEDAYKTLSATPAAPIIMASVSRRRKSSTEYVFSYYHQQPPIF